MNLIPGNMTHAQETGQVSFNGITFTVPERWKGVNQNNMYLMVSDTVAGLIAVMPASFTDLGGLQNELNQQQTDGASILLYRSQEIETLGDKALGAVFEGNFNYEKAKMFVSGTITGNNRGILIFAGTSSEMYSKRYKDLSLQIINSIRTTHASAAKSRSGKTPNDWEQFYGNTRLTYLDSYYSSGYGSSSISGGYSNTIIIDLCSQGYFTYRNDFEMSGGSDFSSFGSNDDQRGSGMWLIRPNNSNSATLMLNFHNGQTIEYSMQYDEKGATYLNGDRFYRTTHNDQVTEHRPQCF